MGYKMGVVGLAILFIFYIVLAFIMESVGMDIEISGLINRSFKNATIYQPIEEAIVNAIHAIQEKENIPEGKISIKFLRAPKYGDEEWKKAAMPHVIWVEIEDNGIGFTDENKKSFETVFSKYKQRIGGIGFWRISYLKFFNTIKIESYYENSWSSFERSWMFIPADNIFSSLKEEENNWPKKHGTKIIFRDIKFWEFDVDFEVIVRRLVEKLLWFFVFGEKLPEIEFIDTDWAKKISFKEFIETTQKIQILKNKDTKLTIKGEEFQIKMVKIYQSIFSNTVNLCAHNRPVKKISMKELIPLFDEHFFDDNEGRFIIQVYVSSKFLDAKVNEERDDFEDILKKNQNQSIFPEYEISMDLIQFSIKNYLIEALHKEYITRKEKRDKDIRKFFDENRYYDDIKDEIDYEKFWQNVEPIELENAINELIFKKKQKLQKKVNAFIKTTHPKISQEELKKIVEEIGFTQKTDLAKYVVGRKLVLDLMEKTLEYDDEGKFAREEKLHEIIFPRYADNTNSKYENNALWILDEKLNFEKYICSEKQLKSKGKKWNDRIDIGVFGERVAFRWENTESTPITVFEFKRPGRTDFINPSEPEDPIEQVMRYIVWLRDGTYTLDNWIEINADDNTPAYGYIVCTISSDVKKWLKLKWAKPLPDWEWFMFFNSELSIIIYIMSWQKLIQDARKRNKIFFKQLWIE